MKIEVRPGDCATSIAHARGLDPDRVWACNDALAQTRPSANVLAPGDALEVPELEAREEPVATGSVGRFVLRVKPVELRLRLTRLGEPRAGEAFALRIEDGETIVGTTNADGWVLATIPAGATRAQLELDDGAEQHALAIGHLDPHDSILGAQQRMRALGAYFGALDGELGDQTRAALRAFQRGRELSATGRLDDATRAALRAAFGS